MKILLFLRIEILKLSILQSEKPKPLISQGTEVLITTENVIEGANIVSSDLNGQTSKQGSKPNDLDATSKGDRNENNGLSINTSGKDGLNSGNIDF